MSLLADAPELREGSHPCESCRMVHVADYAGWCRAERERLFPQNFVRWSEEEHPTGYPLTYAQQRVLWDHIDVWEACFDGDLTLAQTQEYVANLPPVPAMGAVAAMVRTLASSKIPQQRPTASGNFNEREWLAQRAKPVPAPQPAGMLAA